MNAANPYALTNRQIAVKMVQTYYDGGAGVFVAASGQVYNAEKFKTFLDTVGAVNIDNLYVARSPKDAGMDKSAFQEKVMGNMVLAEFGAPKTSSTNTANIASNFASPIPAAAQAAPNPNVNNTTSNVNNTANTQNGNTTTHNGNSQNNMVLVQNHFNVTFTPGQGFSAPDMGQSAGSKQGNSGSKNSPDSNNAGLGGNGSAFHGNNNMFAGNQVSNVLGLAGVNSMAGPAGMNMNATPFIPNFGMQNQFATQGGILPQLSGLSGISSVPSQPAQPQQTGQTITLDQLVPITTSAFFATRFGQLGA
jgi:hypothetical protein